MDRIKTKDYVKRNEAKGRKASQSHSVVQLAVECSQVNRDFSSMYDIVCQEY